MNIHFFSFFVIFHGFIITTKETRKIGHSSALLKMDDLLLYLVLVSDAVAMRSNISYIYLSRSEQIVCASYLVCFWCLFVVFSCFFPSFLMYFGPIFDSNSTVYEDKASVWKTFYSVGLWWCR